MRPAKVLGIAPVVMGGIFIIVGMSIWTTECSIPVPGAIDVLCESSQPYYWLSLLGLGMSVIWGLGILLVEVRQLAGVRGYWKLHLSPTPKITLLFTTTSFGILGILVRRLNGWPPFYAENFVQDYMPWLLGGALIGLLFGALMNSAIRHAEVVI